MRNGIRAVIEDQREERKEVWKGENIIARDIQHYWEENISSPFVKVIMGVRRSGKTTLTHQLLRGKAYAHINFDDERLEQLRRNNTI